MLKIFIIRAGPIMKPRANLIYHFNWLIWGWKTKTTNHGKEIEPDLRRSAPDEVGCIYRWNEEKSQQVSDGNNLVRRSRVDLRRNETRPDHPYSVKKPQKRLNGLSWLLLGGKCPSKHAAGPSAAATRWIWPSSSERASFWPQTGVKTGKKKSLLNKQICMYSEAN